MRFGALRMFLLGKNLLVRFPMKFYEKDDASVLMAGMWIIEEFVKKTTEEGDRKRAVDLICEHVRKRV